jgi:hypothetical protein
MKRRWGPRPAHTCCKAGTVLKDNGRGSLVRRKAGLIRGIIPGVLLLLVPKCPLCLAAYISVATGIGISFTTAKYLRIILIVLCVSSLLFLTLRRVRSLVAGARGE